jgi:2,3-bisphosphoglycerate-independent phosphoglycerate mutase
MADMTEVLKDQPKANSVLLRGFSKSPEIPRMPELFKIDPAAIANYPMYKGLARLLGMKIMDVGGNTEDLFDSLEKHFESHDYFYIHYKKTDSAGEDGDFKAKVEAIEELDAFLPRLVALNPDVLVVTSDHSTPSVLKGHSWHPNPFVLVSRTARRDNVQSFTERSCGQGLLGRFPSLHTMPLMLAHALKLKKYGA